MEKSIENTVEFLNGQDTCTVTFNSRKHINMMKKLHDRKPEDFDYYIENDDGSICARIPLDWLKIRPHRELTKEQRDALAERMKAVREKQRQSVGNDLI